MHTIPQSQEIIDWTLPGLTMYYRDTELPAAIIEKYTVGDIFRSQTFVDVSGFAGKLTKNCRFIFASSKAAAMHKINPATEKWQFNIINANSYFKILDVYQKEGKTQVFCLHIPAKGIDLFKSTKINLGEEDFEGQIIEKARISLDQKMNMAVVPALEEAEWIGRTNFPIGLDMQNNFFSLYPSEELQGEGATVHAGLRKIINDTSDINVPIVKPNAPKNKPGFWKRLFN